MGQLLPEQGGGEVDAHTGGQGDDQLAGEAQPGEGALLRGGVEVVVEVASICSGRTTGIGPVDGCDSTRRRGAARGRPWAAGSARAVRAVVSAGRVGIGPTAGTPGLRSGRMPGIAGGRTGRGSGRRMSRVRADRPPLGAARRSARRALGPGRSTDRSLLRRP